MSRLSLFGLLTSALVICTPALADEKPNLQPGNWSHTTTTTLEGAVNTPPQTVTQEQCLTQEQIDQGPGMLDLPDECTVNAMNVTYDKADFSLTCEMHGLPMTFNGNTTFEGDHMDGTMHSNVDTPMGNMMMSMTFSAKRIGDCP